MDERNGLKPIYRGMCLTLTSYYVDLFGMVNSRIVINYQITYIADLVGSLCLKRERLTGKRMGRVTRIRGQLKTSRDAEMLAKRTALGIPISATLEYYLTYYNRSLLGSLFVNVCLFAL